MNEKILTLKSALLGWGMILFFVVFNSFGTWVLKTQIQKIRYGSSSFFLSLFSFWQSWIGLASISLAMGAWMIALSHLELSRAYPAAIGLNLIVIVTLSLFHFHEPITFPKILGILFLLFGLTLVTTQ